MNLKKDHHRQTRIDDQKIGTQARNELLNIYDCKINLKLFVKVEKEWRNDDYLIKSLGHKNEFYNQKGYIIDYFDHNENDQIIKILFDDNTLTSLISVGSKRSYLKREIHHTRIITWFWVFSSTLNWATVKTQKDP